MEPITRLELVRGLPFRDPKLAELARIADAGRFRMAWTASMAFSSFKKDMFGNVAAFNLAAAGDSIKCALYGTTPTPNNEDTSANNAYNAGQWISGNVATDTQSNWATAGVILGSQTITSATGTLKWTASNATATPTTITNAYGCLIYDDTLAAPVAKQAMFAVYFGGPYSTSAGTFTIQWSGSGIFTWA